MRTALDSISRLPEAARAEVSQALVDGKTWRFIAPLCERHGLKGVTPQNVTNYKQSTMHEQWKARRDRMAKIREEQAESQEIFEAAQAQGMNPADAACFVGSRKVLKLITGLDLSVIEEAAAEDPRLLIEVLKAAKALADGLRAGKSQTARETSAKGSSVAGPMTQEEKTRKMKEFFGIA